MTSPTPRPHRIALAAVFLALVLALAACGGDDEEIDPGNAADAPDFSAAVEAAPPELAALYEDGGTLVAGGREEYERRIAELEGYPVVVNKWASWCGPCRAEFPYLQEQAARRADEVAFLGINTNDSDDAAETFLRDHPVPYPSVSDPDSEIANSLGAVNFPSTIFYDAEGEVVYTHQGVYASEEELAADIDEYARPG